MRQRYDTLVYIMIQADTEMSESTTIHVRLSAQAVRRLDALAQSTRRSRSFLAAEAIAAFVESNAWQVEHVEKAVASADAGGPFVPQDEVSRWVDSWDSEQELERPLATRR